MTRDTNLEARVAAVEGHLEDLVNCNAAPYDLQIR